MAKVLRDKSLYYNDVNLIAQRCKVKSRSDIPKELHRIIVSPMQSIIGKTFALKANELGLSLCLHRFCEIKEEVELFKSLSNKENVFVSVGLKDWDRVSALANAGADNWLLDMANGYMVDEINTFIHGMSDFPMKKLMLGNIHTAEGFFDLDYISDHSGVERFVRVGIAGGSPCATNDSTGYNRGPITEIMEIEGSNKLDVSPEYKKPYIIADGGIKNSGYAAKAFAAGADYVMMGGYFVKSLEAETHIIGDGHYWGGASHKQQILQTGTAHRHSEGKEIPVLDELAPLETLVKELWGGISSAVSYGGYDTLTNFIGNGVFEIKQNSLPPRRG